MQVSYGKLTMNDGKETVMGASHQRHDVTLSGGFTWSETAYFGGWKKFLYFMTHV